VSKRLPRWLGGRGIFDELVPLLRNVDHQTTSHSGRDRRTLRVVHRPIKQAARSLESLLVGERALLELRFPTRFAFRERLLLLGGGWRIAAFLRIVDERDWAFVDQRDLCGLLVGRELASDDPRSSSLGTCHRTVLL
jgi:hypothetical protein